MYARATFPFSSLSASRSPPKWLLIERTGNGKPRTELVIYEIQYTCCRVLNLAVKYAPQYVSVITKSLHVIKWFLFFCDSEDFNVMSGSDWALLTSLKHYKCWDNTNWQTECLRFLFFQGKDTFFLLAFLLFRSFSCIDAIYLNGLSLHCGNSSSTCAMCETKRKVCFNTINPTIPHSDEREIVTICGCVSHHFA